MTATVPATDSGGGHVRLRLDIAYDGTDFAGWAAQDGQRTVAGVLEDALSTVFRVRVRLFAAGRTDAGVHASGQVAHLDVPAGSLGHAFPLPMEIFDPKFTVLSADGDPLRAIAMGFRQTVRMIEQVFLTLDRVGRGSVGVEQLQGPVGILHTGTQVADEGFMYVLFFLALISVNLAVVNALPIPIADGGLFVFLMYEKFRGRPPSIAFQNAAAMAGIALVAGVFLLTFYNDIARIFGS